MNFDGQVSERKMELIQENTREYKDVTVTMNLWHDGEGLNPKIKGPTDGHSTELQ